MEIIEGLVKIDVPYGRIYDAEVFYNPDARFVRDINVAVLSVFQRELGSEMSILDALSASGMSGIRYAKEVPSVSVTLNDRNPEAVKLMEKNTEKNNVSVTILNKDANLVMRENLYDFIDIDPFGSPCIFMDSAAHSVKYNRLVAVTATDTGALCGSFSNACMRKYGIRAVKTPYYQELGLRVLITFIMNTFMRYEKAFRPLLCISHKHYYRVWGVVEGAGKVNDLMKQYKNVDKIGLLYMGKIKDNDFVRKVKDEIEKRGFDKKELNLMGRIIAEIDEPFYYDISKMKIKKVPKIDDVIYELKKKGFDASRSSLCDSGIKTNASLEEFEKITK